MDIKFKSWSDISIAKYYKISDLQKNKIDTHEGIAKLISILSDEDEKYIKSLTIRQIQELYFKCAFITEPLPEKNVNLDKIIINGTKYMISNDLDKFSVAQLIDYSAYTQRPERCIAQILSTIMIPEGKTYNDGYSIDNTINDIENYLDIATAVMLFNDLKKKFRTSVDHTLHSLEKQTKTLMKMTKNKEKKGLLQKIMAKLKKEEKTYK